MEFSFWEFDGAFCWLMEGPDAPPYYTFTYASGGFFAS